MENEPNPTEPAFRPELIIKKEKELKVVSNSGLSWLLIIFVLVLLALAVSMFRQPVASDTSGLSGQSHIGSSLGPTPEIKQPRVYTVSYRNGVFSPTNLRIHAGDTVRFKNEGIFPIRIVSDPHPEHNGLVGFDSVGDIPQGSFFSFTFAARGIFGYHNEKSPDELATIIIR